ncbi:oxysterol-binding protein-related protein 1-like [Rhopilema esculentum]|uniref:oxysterol-binding protein-related protein 1-like n=1 Tax=Rhopilema esculentum TaxID=499914 RepID=UPI0031E11186
MKMENIPNFDQKEEKLLQAARKGDLAVVNSLLDLSNDGTSTLDINCKGQNKSNFGWSPLHLAAYFGHEFVAEALLTHGADVNILNGMGDTPLHRAAFTGRTSVVLLLLKFGANVSIINGEGRTPLQMADNQEVLNLIKAAERSQKLRCNEKLLNAAREGNMKRTKELLGCPSPPNINCRDLMGNTPLHCAAYRGHKEVAVLLLQNGIDSTIKNNRGLTASELARDDKMRQLLDVQPMQVVQKTVQRFEGYLMKRTRVFGWKKLWVVLERGILSAFSGRADAASGIKRHFHKYLDNAKFHNSREDKSKFQVQYNDHTVHMWSVIPTAAQVDRQRWLNALQDHCAYSTHYTTMPHVVLLDELDEDYLPLGSMEDALKSAKAHQQLLEQQVFSLVAYFNTLQDQNIRQGTTANLKFKLNEVVMTSQEVCTNLNHCLSVMSQQDEVRRLQLEEETEKRRVLEDALHVLAQEHHALEKSVQIKARRGGSHRVIETDSDLEDFEEFYDAPLEFMDSFERSVQMSTEVKPNGTFTAIRENPGKDSLDGLPLEELRKPRFQNGATILEEKAILDEIREGCFGDVQNSPEKLQLNKSKYRTRLPHNMHSRSEFSVWTVLKQAIGKDLSRIAMPVVFNEPLSFLQRIVEYGDYIELISQAAKTDDPVKRIELIAGFAVSAQSPNAGRIGKPFNPLLGETYELVREDLGFKLIAEQVSHHPPVSALHCEGDGFFLHLSIEPALKFWGKDIEVRTKGNLTIEIPKYNEAYTFGPVQTAVHNIIVGTLWIELVGTVNIVSHRSGHQCNLNFKPAGWFGKDLNQVEGHVLDEKKNKVRLVKGDWTSHFYSCPADQPDIILNDKSEQSEGKFVLPEGADLIWKVRRKPLYAAEMYNMTEFAMSLNELRTEHKTTIAPTDCRFRPDIKALENGDIDLAADEKFRLEEKQRASRRDRHQKEEKWRTRWFEFEINKWTGKEDWIYKNKYFERNWSDSPDIY